MYHWTELKEEWVYLTGFDNRCLVWRSQDDAEGDDGSNCVDINWSGCDHPDTACDDAGMSPVEQF